MKEKVMKFLKAYALYIVIFIVSMAIVGSLVCVAFLATVIPAFAVILELLKGLALWVALSTFLAFIIMLVSRIVLRNSGLCRHCWTWRTSERCNYDWDCEHCHKTNDL